MLREARALVIACGALAAPEQLKAISCPIIAIVGMDDFNFMEAAQYIINPAAIPSNLSIETTNASHAWPASKRLSQASGYLLLSKPGNNTCIDTKSLLQAFMAKQNSRLDSFTRSKDELSAMLLTQNLSNSATFESIGKFRSRYLNLLKSEAFIHQATRVQNCKPLPL